MTYRKSPFARTVKSPENKKSQTESTVYLYDEIGFFGVSAEAFVKDLGEIDSSTIHLRINSPGGSVFDGMAIYNAIRQHKSKVVAHVDGLAASISSVIALAADEVVMSDKAFFMIHDPWSISVGNAEILRKDAELLDKAGAMIAKTYIEKSGRPEKEILNYMKDETWFTASEALDVGLIDSIDKDVEDKEVSNLFDLSIYANVPDKLRDSGPTPTERELEKILRDAGFSRSQAKAILTEGFRPELRDAVRVDAAPPAEAQRDAVAAPAVKDRVADLLIRAEKAAPNTTDNE